MDVILAAGGVPLPEDPLYPHTQGKPKAMLKLAGKPMIQWVLDALAGSEHVNNIVIIGLDPDQGLTCEKTLIYLAAQGSMVENIRAGLLKVHETNPEAKKILAASTDIPAIRTEMVDWLVERVQESDDDVYYCVIPRETMENRYPDSKRTYTHLKGMEVCGGDMNALDIRLIEGDDEIWERLTQARKSVLRQAALIGFGTLLLLLLRQATIDRAVKRVSKSLGVKGRALICPYAEMGMDVDKPFQLEILERELLRQQQSGS